MPLMTSLLESTGTVFLLTLVSILNLRPRRPCMTSRPTHHCLISISVVARTVKASLLAPARPCLPPCFTATPSFQVLREDTLLDFAPLILYI
jgi:hypothetical protein